MEKEPGKLIITNDKGEKLEWKNITKEQLEELFEKRSDSVIAELYGVSKSQVTSKRRKWDIKLINYTVKNFLSENSNKALFENLNQSSKERLLDENNTDTLSIALTHIHLFQIQMK